MTASFSSVPFHTDGENASPNLLVRVALAAVKKATFVLPQHILGRRERCAQTFPPPPLMVGSWAQ